MGEPGQGNSPLGGQKPGSAAIIWRSWHWGERFCHIIRNLVDYLCNLLMFCMCVLVTCLWKSSWSWKNLGWSAESLLKRTDNKSPMHGFFSETTTTPFSSKPNKKRKMDKKKIVQSTFDKLDDQAGYWIEDVESNKYWDCWVFWVYTIE